MWSDVAKLVAYPARAGYLWFGGCGAPGSGPATSTPSTTANPYTSLPFIVGGMTTALIGCGLVAIILSQRAQIGLAARRWIRWPYLAACAVALLGIAWAWQLSSTYNDAGCVVYLRAWPVDESSVSLVAVLLILGPFALALVYLALAIALFIRRLRWNRRALRAG